MNDSSQEGVPLSHALGNGTMGQPPRARPSLKALAARVLEGARESVPLSHALETGTEGQAVAGSAPRHSTWDADDWRAFLEERAGIAEHDGGLERIDAEQQAFECCVMEWLWRNPPPASGPERCAYCGEPLSEAGADGDQVNFPGLPYLTGNGGHTWLHTGCHGDWTVLRRAAAVAALAILGLPTALARSELPDPIRRPAPAPTDRGHLS